MVGKEIGNMAGSHTIFLLAICLNVTGNFLIMARMLPWTGSLMVVGSLAILKETSCPQDKKLMLAAGLVSGINLLHWCILQIMETL